MAIQTPGQGTVQPILGNPNLALDIANETNRGNIASSKQRDYEQITSIAQGVNTASDNYYGIKEKQSVLEQRAANLESTRINNESAQLDLQNKAAQEDATLQRDMMVLAKETANASIASDLASISKEAYQMAASENEMDVINMLTDPKYARFRADPKKKEYLEDVASNLFATGSPQARKELQELYYDPIEISKKREAAKVSLAENDKQKNTLKEDYFKNPDIRFLDPKKLNNAVVVTNPKTGKTDIQYADDGSYLSEESNLKRGTIDSAVGHVRRANDLENNRRFIKADANGEDRDKVLTVEQEVQKGIDQSQKQFQQQAQQGQQQPGQQPQQGQFGKPVVEESEAKQIQSIRNQVNIEARDEMEKRFDLFPEHLGGETEKAVLDEIKQEEQLKKEYITTARSARGVAKNTGESIIAKVGGAIDTIDALGGTDILGDSPITWGKRSISRLDPETVDKILKPLQTAADEFKLKFLTDSGLGVRVADSEAEMKAFQSISFDPSLSVEQLRYNLNLLKRGNQFIKDREDFDNMLIDTNMTKTEIDTKFKEYKAAHPPFDTIDGKVVPAIDRKSPKEWLQLEYGLRSPASFTNPPPATSEEMNADGAATGGAGEIQAKATTPEQGVGQSSLGGSQADQGQPQATPASEAAQQATPTPEGITPSVEGQKNLAPDTTESNATFTQPNAIIEKASPNLIAGVISTESAGKWDAVSSAGAFGLTQLMPATGAEQYEQMGGDPANYEKAIRDPKNGPNLQVAIGTRYLNQQIKAFGGNQDLALAAYNGGPGTVRKAIRKAGGSTDFEDIKPFLPKETQEYVGKVKKKALAHSKVNAQKEQQEGPSFGQKLATGAIGDVATNALAFLANAGNAVTFGFSDNAIGLLESGASKITGIEPSTTTAQQMREGIDTARKEAPVSSTLGTIGGTIVQGVASAGTKLVGGIVKTATSGTSAIGRISATSGLAGLETGLQAAGEADDEGAMGKITDGLIAAPIGAVFGFAAGTGLEIGKQTLKMSGNLIKSVFKKTPFKGTKAEIEAQEFLFKKLKDSSPEELEEVIQGLQSRSDLPKSLVTELKNKSVDDLADIISQHPSVASKVGKAVTEIADTSKARLKTIIGETDDIAEASGKLLKAVDEKQVELAAIRQAEAGPHYAAAFKRGPQSSEDLTEVLKLGVVDDAIQSAKGVVKQTAETSKAAGRVGSGGKTIKTSKPLANNDPRVLDEAITQLSKDAALPGKAGYNAGIAAKELRKATFDLFPELKTARGAYRELSKSGLNKFTPRQTRVLDSIEKGGDFENLGPKLFKLEPRELSELKSLLGPKNAEQFETLGKNYLKKELGRIAEDGNTTPFIKKFLSEDNETTFRALVGDDIADTIKMAVKGEKDIMRIKGVTSPNSKTFGRQAGTKELEGAVDPGGVAGRDADAGGIYAAVAKVFKKVTGIGDVNQKAVDATAKELADLVILQPDKAIDFLQVGVAEMNKAAGKKESLQFIGKFLEHVDVGAGVRIGTRGAVRDTITDN